MAQKYSVVKDDAIGPTELLASNCFLRVAMAIATREAEKLRSSGSDARVYVQWYRKSDGQKGYVNPDGNHAITGKAW